MPVIDCPGVFAYLRRSEVAASGRFLFISAKTAVKAALLHNGVGGVAGLYFAVHGEVPPGDRAVPNVMVTFSMPDKGTAVFGQLRPHLFLIFGHYIASLSQRSDTMRSWTGAGAVPLGLV